MKEAASTHRITTLADGVFAIVMTLLQLWPRILAYIVSFLNLGIFWMRHQ